ncbi:MULTISPECIES: bifunctional 2-C-methyl-D-erythritol 4-phosphate cytidylyltransferase/2-C-methyl-D-erythritol 2,4-cyclodiphosphate synthase [unclassified Sphingobium]|uniref:bifunctional 2-C-methyl-D-erythritol 4-phosphate cytidylyltransferase/2-C-methyl-D-erythritol 2,4-cyclodiphosphate synthase n=1 Tax=unclassified Sphingobium TaxID=2611147 RepID=UPI002223FAE8|nr:MULTISPECIES: bifunctional 2-C-methyl-D-erythritol 4-phosphate cytidylyltransferase/2-C-methyl-D-erythritol 2,4-cyclodiphosphate synthase [unclassified Sphingobium]MCW2394500.1 2-C-methyl-D-erythritol 4-phosphate cytidylyltransferase/2-C-methyl-D-erythritol 2,4-cyclodiphosphate synthase [Sphingobium sp. B8D3B]MCW2418014.1 2-C-methyl-D-erythritol 4-phosphate cytidylyltransferase/2-C-methyl-D-erythritol 2,4-cyclodiphosphate synthase [Sphingobium sp. B8D3C]
MPDQAPRAGLSAAVLLAAGAGLRTGHETPKQLRTLAGKPVVAHALDALRAHPGVGPVALVVTPGSEDAMRSLLGPRAEGLTIVAGGSSRRLSVLAGLEALAGSEPGSAHVLVHDSARPLLPVAVIDRVLGALADGARCVVPVLPVVDTLVRSSGDEAGQVVDRSTLARVQTPQGFDFAALTAVHQNWTGPEEPTDDAQMLRRAGIDVALVPGDSALEKITGPGDHERMERLLTVGMSTRVGMGFDVHRLVEGEDLWLCGVQIPHSHGLSGHSDADVAIHALVDAILGALAEGDIGSHFSPSDPQWKGAASDRFLAFACDRVSARGGRIDHVDVTIICEAPKIGPHRAAMRTRLAAIMTLPETRISVKATTTERLGLTGRGEGIAAQALVTLRLPDDDVEAAS